MWFKLFAQSFNNQSGSLSREKKSDFRSFSPLCEHFPRLFLFLIVPGFIFWRSRSDLRWWFCAASPSPPPALTRHCPPGQGGWCGTFQTSCGTGGEPHLARTSWLTCGPVLAGGPGPPSWAASSWQCQPWKSESGWETDKRHTVSGRKERYMKSD